MQFSVETVSPDLAKTYVMTNTSHNRRISRQRVKFYADQIRNGDWRLSPQGLIFDTHGRLINGQHRLYAVIEAGKEVPFTVIRNAEADTFGILDCGMSRTLSFRSGVESHRAGIATALLKAMRGDASSAVSVDDLMLYYKAFQPQIDTIAGASSRKKISVAPLQAAVALHMHEGNEYAFDQYRAMVHIDATNMSPCTAGLLKRLLDNASINGSAVERNEIFVRAFKTFNPKNASKKFLNISNVIEEINKIRPRIEKAIAAHDQQVS